MVTDDEFDHADRRLRTLQHCALHRRTIRLECPACGRIVRMEAVPLWWWFERHGWTTDCPALGGGSTAARVAGGTAG